MKTLKTSALITLLLAPLAALQAGESADADPAAVRAKLFDALDKNNDGSLSKDEFMVAKKSVEDPERAARVFELRDTDGSDSLSKEEFVKVRESGKTDE